MTTTKTDILKQLDEMTPQELKRHLAEELTSKRLGLNWEADLIERDKALNANLVLPKVDETLSHWESEQTSSNLIIEGDNFDSLRLLRATHRGCIRVIYIDPPYNTGNKDWVYNDDYVKKDDRWKHSKWLEFLYQRLTLARDLLTPDGVILISINDENRARLELLMDEIMPGQKAGSFVWRVRSGGNDTKGALLSINHEHVLVYSNPGFVFRGDERNDTAYKNPDEDSRGPWCNDNLVKAHNARQRPEAYYHIQNPETGIWYPCDPDSVWRFASTTRPLKKDLQSDPMETVISEKRILWPDPDSYVIYDTINELISALRSGTAPRQLKIYNDIDALKSQSKSDIRVARLLDYIDPIESWVGVKIGTKKPRYKRFQKDLRRNIRPLSSWLQPEALTKNREDTENFDELTELTVGATGEGTQMYKRILDNKEFSYPKPNSLIKNLIDQSTRPGDIVLDFFAGSGTTGHAVMDLNQQDGGNRSFILCSSTEATKKEPNKNLCKDICAERIRRVANGYGNTPGIGGSFTYLTLDLVEEADLMFDASAEHAYNLIALRTTGRGSNPPSDQPVWVVSDDGTNAIVVCPRVTDDTIAALKALGASRLIVYSPRPGAVREAVEADKAGVTSYSIEQALKYAQTGNQSQAPSPVAEVEAGGSQ